MSDESEFMRLLRLMQESSPDADRFKFLKEMHNAIASATPFYQQWLLDHDVAPYWDCWSDDGYDPSKSKFPRDVQLLAAANYGKADIDNGGFHQFFSNGTGVFAPELAEWFERAGLTQTALCVREAIALFGDPFPRSQLARQEFLARYSGESREEWDPFHQMDDRFYETATKEVFDEAANRWLRDVCGIARIEDGF